jgi:hypothetical protein
MRIRTAGFRLEEDGVAKKATSKKKAAAAKAPSKRGAGGDGPVLLSGGNPQIPKGDGDGPVRAYLDAMPGWKGDVGRRLDGLIVGAVPGVRKAVRWNSPFYGVEGRGWFVSFHCMTRYVKVAFFRGSSLDPLPPVGSKQPEVRYLHVFEGEEIDEGLVTGWVKQASELPGEDCF